MEKDGPPNFPLPQMSAYFLYDCYLWHQESNKNTTALESLRHERGKPEKEENELLMNRCKKEILTIYAFFQIQR